MNRRDFLELIAEGRDASKKVVINWLLVRKFGWTKGIVLNQIAYWNETHGGGEPVSIKRLSQLCNMTYRNLQRVIKELESEGWLTVVLKTGGASQYTLSGGNNTSANSEGGSRQNVVGGVRQNDVGGHDNLSGGVTTKCRTHGTTKCRTKRDRIETELKTRAHPRLEAAVERWENGLADGQYKGPSGSRAVKLIQSKVSEGLFCIDDFEKALDWICNSEHWSKRVRHPVDLVAANADGGILWDEVWSEMHLNSDKIITLHPPERKEDQSIKTSEGRGDDSIQTAAPPSSLQSVYRLHFTVLVNAGVEKRENWPVWRDSNLGEYERAVRNGWASEGDLLAVWEWVARREKERKKDEFSWASVLRMVGPMFRSRGKGRGRKWDSVRSQAMSGKGGRGRNSGMISHGEEYAANLPF